MKRLLFILAMLIVTAVLAASSPTSTRGFAACVEKDCVTINGCSIECNACAGSGHDRKCKFSE
jgi:hypothetical protein